MKAHYPRTKVPGHPRGIGRNGWVHTHIVIAERALGKPLPPGAEVHHVDGDRTNNKNTNLVICQDHGYHFLLHVRARVVRAGGNPNTERVCCSCHQAKRFAEFNAGTRRQLHGQCRDCQRIYWQDYQRRRKAAS